MLAWLAEAVSARRSQGAELHVSRLLGVRGADAALLLDAGQPVRPLPDPLHGPHRRLLLPGG